MHPKIAGKITDKISIHKIGINNVHRVMRVEGINANGNSGYYEKDVTEINDASAWVFHPTNETLDGNLLNNLPYDYSDLTTAANEDKPYDINMDNYNSLSTSLPWWRIINKDDWAAELKNFSTYNSPTDLRIHLGAGDFIDLKLHTTELIRQNVIERGLTERPRAIGGTLEVPASLLNNFDSLSHKAKVFIKSYLMKRQFTQVDVSASSDKVIISGTAGGLIMWWEFTPTR
jgi:hypothetical protein